MRDVCIVGGGVAGLAASIFTARAGLDTLVVDGGESILARNASLENYPGFPDGVDARRYLQLSREQARTAGAEFELGRVTRAEPVAETDLEAGFTLETEGGEPLEARRVIAASWSDSDYLVPLDVGRIQRGSKHFVSTDAAGRTAVDGVYAAGRLAEEPHQAIVAAGHGAKVGLAAVHDSDANFYHDWVTPEGYFTGRGREVPPGCEEIDDDERRRRDEQARARMLEAFEEPLDEAPTMHPSVDRE
ncbi:FAD-dependent pyridine nucleotide-disulfide oxidoreductase [Natrinema pellirubrum DSM 15624]|uniref:FAD-dependent pyridine nucleotide-disulfide oxidoreductase n=1 Tax=Natrinema pellirubrum (strain DSM 15624 / CIP 106293 / JCM 10476 / NCIMB 786 / 157) TaxID=797303 RepID=L0JQD1_NATP1|nr:NAD(P)/FAD-dependent oxidoreductase [Natrinema pellirubrum]AGB32807.1 thioredoxin reductase [Natrinema pellirubrum DSM 15624]ELY75569.1 FAD-dependent pyridine nucleotide-disulfide oxidoreductase [Natrinema pellirubrum DSM 15624]